MPCDNENTVPCRNINFNADYDFVIYAITPDNKFYGVIEYTFTGNYLGLTAAFTLNNKSLNCKGMAIGGYVIAGGTTLISSSMESVNNLTGDKITVNGNGTVTLNGVTYLVKGVNGKNIVKVNGKAYVIKEYEDNVTLNSDESITINGKNI